MTQMAVVLTTVADDEHAESLARQIVEERLAACVSLYPAMLSFYRWQGRVAREGERQMVIKTTLDRVSALEVRLKALHSYELPEFVVLSIDDGSEAYLTWVAEQTRPG